MSLTIDTREWDTAVRRLLDASGTGMRGTEADRVIRQSVGLVVRDAYRMTPPFGSSPVTEGPAKQKKIGQKAIERDINRVFLTPGEAVAMLKQSNPRAGVIAARMAASQKHTELLEFLRGSGAQQVKVNGYARGGRTVGGYTRTIKSPTFARGGFSALQATASSPDAAIHNAQRDNRGRVKNQRPKILLTNPASLKTYIRTRLKQLGKAKSGWSKALAAFGQSSASWTRQAVGSGISRVETGNSSNIYTVGNAVNYIQSTGANLSIMRRAIESQTENLNRRIKAALDTSLRRMFRP